MFKFIGILLYLISAYTYAAAEKFQDKLAYLEYSNDYWQVVIKDSATKGESVSASSYDKSSITWLADGENVFSCGIQGEAEIINIKTGRSQPITLPEKSINDAVISPDGRYILYSNIAKDSTDNKLWLYNVTEKSSKPLLHKMQGRQYDPKWNVNGDAFYFVSGVANTSYEIHKALLSDLKSHVVVSNSRYNLDVEAYFSEKVVYSSNLGGGFDIWVRDNNQVKQVTTIEGSESHPSWSSDGKRIYFEKLDNGITNIWAINISSEDLKQVTFSETGARFPVIYKGLLK